MLMLLQLLPFLFPIELDRLASFRYITYYGKYIYGKYFEEGMVKDATG